MAYEKQTWIAREGVNLKKYTKASETATTVILTNTPDSISVEGTPFSVDRMNHIEDGIANATVADIYDSETYETGLSQTTRKWSAMATNGIDMYASVSNATPGGGSGIYKQTAGTGNFTLYWGHDSAEITGVVCYNNDILYCVKNGDIYRQTNGTGDFIALNQLEICR